MRASAIRPRAAPTPRAGGIVREALPTRDLADWRAPLRAGDLPFASVTRAADLPDDAQAVAAGIIVETAIPRCRADRRAFHAGRRRVPPAEPGPGLGAHSEEILREAGVSADEIAALRASGALG